MTRLGDIPSDCPVLIAGPTASGKSSLALELARAGGGVVVNADALQVYGNWRVLTARPPAEDEALAPHRLYGHIRPDQTYSVGHWLREVADILAGPERPIIVGGTGLYLTALTEGLAEIPEVPASVRAEAEARLAGAGLDAMVADLDAPTRARLDLRNPRRVQRAWEVLRATGRGLADWQDDTGPALLPLSRASAFVLPAPPEWLNPRIEARFDAMLAGGALDEARANLDGWAPSRPASQALGAPELIAYLQGRLDLDQARQSAIIATRQYAKRQRSWFRARMKAWTYLPLTL